MNNLCYGMKVINLTQLPGGNLSHPNNALDMAGSDTGIDFWFAQGDWQCVAGPWGYGTYFFVPVNSDGNVTQVHCADGVDRIVTLAMTHSNQQFVSTKKGKIYKNGTPMYEEGTEGYATGNHIHVEVANGIQTTKYKGNDGTWRMNQELEILNVMYVNDSFSTVSSYSLGKNLLKHCASLTAKGGGSSMSMNGIDISNWQGGMNLSDVLKKTDTGFVIAKATEGVDFTDKYFNGFIDTALKAGKKVGFYHFARPEKNSAEAEAKYFYEHVKKYVGKGILVLDWESSGKSNVTWAKKWLDLVHSYTGVKPMIYMSESVVNAYDWSAVAKASYGLWVAKYRDNLVDYNYDMSNAGAKPIVKYWNGYAMWQWTSSGRLDGYLSNLDCNIFYGDRTAWDKYAGSYGEWKKTDGQWYYIKNGKKVTGWQELPWSGGTDWFYFDSNGVMQTGWHYLKWSGGKSWFYFDTTGAMLKGFQYLKWNGKSDWYYLDEKSGAMKTGELTMTLNFGNSGELTGGKKA